MCSHRTDSKLVNVPSVDCAIPAAKTPFEIVDKFS